MAEPVLPALSLAVALTVCEPTVSPYPLTVQEPATPEVASSAVQPGAAGTKPK